MSAAQITMALCGVVIAGVIYWLNSIPVPEGFHDPWFFRLAHTVMKLFRGYNRLKIKLGHDAGDLLVAGRQNKWLMSKPANLPVRVEDKSFGGVSVRMFIPEGIPATGNPGIAYYHGGGWVISNVEQYTPYCTELSHETRTIIMSVEYRLAPEHPFPVPLEDCVKATKHFIEHAQELGVNQDRIALVGDSAGGNLAAATGLCLRDEKIQPQPKLQVLMYPCLQAMDMYSPSYQANSNDALLPKASMALFWLLYATGKSKNLKEIIKNKHTTPTIKTQLATNQLNHDAIRERFSANDYEKQSLELGDATLWDELKAVLTDPYFAPLMAKDVSGLPEALVFTVEHDVLRDDGIWYSQYMESAGVKVTHHHYKPAIHGMMTMTFNKQDFIEARHLVYDGIKSKL